jgi:hypothetical protein
LFTPKPKFPPTGTHSPVPASWLPWVHPATTQRTRHLIELWGMPRSRKAPATLGRTAFYGLCGATGDFRTWQSSERKPSISLKTLALAVYQRNELSRRAVTRPSLRSFCKWWDSVDHGMPISSCRSPTVFLPIGAAINDCMIRKRDSAPIAEKRLANVLVLSALVRRFMPLNSREMGILRG